MKTVLQRIIDLTKIDLEHKSISELFQSVVEELGELARELSIEDGVFGKDKKTPGVDGSQMESVDLAICALAMYFARGGTVDTLEAKMHSKLDKWQLDQDNN
jgi:hypothetical protein